LPQQYYHGNKIGLGTSTLDWRPHYHILLAGEHKRFLWKTR
jgi:hypothetical protein